MEKNTNKKIRLLRYLTIIVFLPTVIVFVLFQLGKLSLEHMVIINLLITIIEIALFTIGTRIIIKDYNSSPNVLILKGKFDNKYLKGNTEIFDRFIIPTNPRRNCIFRIYMELHDKFIGPSLELSIIRSCEAETCEQKIDANNKEGSRTLLLKIDPREKINFKFNKDIKIKSFTVEEFYVP